MAPSPSGDSRPTEFALPLRGSRSREMSTITADVGEGPASQPDVNAMQLVKYTKSPDTAKSNDSSPSKTDPKADNDPSKIQHFNLNSQMFHTINHAASLFVKTRGARNKVRDEEDEWFQPTCAMHLSANQLMSLTKCLIRMTRFPLGSTSKAPLKVAQSNIPGAGRGLLAMAAVKSGDPIFTIDRPLLSIVGNGQHAGSNTCDYCFASIETRGRGGNVSTNAREGLRLTFCQVLS
jgi:hypothetical protein